ncbi:MAG: amidohydrolase family protein [Conexivisphaera sp.]
MGVKGEGALVIRAGRAFTGRSSSEVMEGATIVVRGGSIRRILRGDSAPIPADAVAGGEIVEVDVRNYFVMPGMIDLHVHLVGSGDASLFAAAPRAPGYGAFVAARNALRTLEAGFTAVRDLGASGYEVLALRDAVRDGLARGPRIYAAGRPLTETGGHGDTPYFNGRVCDGADDCRRAVREQIKAGVDVIKLMASGGGLSPQDDPRFPQFTVDEISAIVHEAHSKGRRVAAHSQSDVGTRNALAGGVDTIEHGVRLDEGICREMIERGTVLVPTMSVPERTATSSGSGVPEWALRKILDVLEIHRRGVRMAHDAGVPIGLGTDAGTPYNPHGANAGELLFLTSHGGLTNGEALYSATGIGARALGLEGTLGVLSEGAEADVIAVRGDPMEDIRALADPDNVRIVVKGGILEKGKP